MSSLLEKMNIAGMLVVPIYVENRVWGFISFDSDKQAVWSKAEEEGLKIAADVFGAAFQRRQVEQQIEQLHRAEHDQRQMAEALRDTAEILNASLNLQEVFDQVLANVEKVVPMDAANIMVIEEDIARVVGARGYQERGLQDYVMNLRFQIKNFPGFAYMFEEGRPTINFLSGSRDTWGIDPSFNWIQSFASAPIRQDGKTVGFLNIDSVTPDRYTQAHADRLQVFADQAALAIRNARLLEDARRRAQQMQHGLADRALGVEVPADKQMMVGYGTYGHVMDTLEKPISATPYVAGDSFTAADVYVGAHVAWGLQFGTIEKRPAFEAYWKRLETRPAQIRASALDDADMPKET